MPLNRLHLVVDDDLGPALWVRVQAEGGGSRPAADLTALLDEAPSGLSDALSRALGRHEGPLRHRVRVRGRTSEHRVPALPLDGEALLDVVGAIGDLVAARTGAGAEPTGPTGPSGPTGSSDTGSEVAAVIGPLVEAGTSLRLSDQVIAMPDLLTAVVLDLHAERLVAARHVRVRILERFGRPWARWMALEDDAQPLLHSIVDARAREAFARHVGSRRRAETETPEDDAAKDPTALISSLSAPSADTPVRADVPTQRRMQLALDAFIDSGRARVHLSSTGSELVVRLHEPPLGTAWPLQTCLRDADGTVRPVADLRAVGDVGVEGAAEASAEVMRLAPTVREAAVDDTGVDWLLTTAQASAFLAHDTGALEAAGVTVMLPREWTKQKTRLQAVVGEEEAEQEKTGSGVGMQAMARFDWKMSVGDVDLTEDEISEIRAAQAELVQLRGQWVRLDSTTLRAAERFLDAFTAKRRGRGDGEGGADGGGAVDGARRAPTRRPDAPREAGRPEPIAESAGSMHWGEMFALLGSAQAEGLQVRLQAEDAAPAPPHAGAPARGRSNGLRNLVPGGPGPLPLPQPERLDASLRGYQLEGLNWMWALHELGLGGILADDMGLGKTMQVLALLSREREPDPAAVAPEVRPARVRPRPGARSRTHGAGPAPGPTLLVCPMSVVGSWQREAARFAPDLAVHVHHGGDRIRDASFAEGAADVDLVITTYSLLDRDLEVLSQVRWHRLVLDEAQHVKNAGTAVAKAARALPAPHRLALTGTPVENRLSDLHALMETVNPGLLGSAASFQEHLAGPIEKDGDESALERLRALTSPFVLRRVKTDPSIISDLPAKIDMVRTVNLTPEQAGLYEALVGELMAQIDGADQNQRRTLVVSTLTKLKQVCNHPAHYLGDGSGILRDGEHRSGKLEYVDDLLGSAFADGEKVLLFTQFTTFGHMLVPYWRERFGREIPFLHGGVKKADRDAMVARFQSTPGEPGAMLLSLRAGGTGLTLTAANHVVHLDRWWNPAVENQATDRAFRIGQTKDVQVRKLVAAGTVEERIDNVLAEKQTLADLTITPVENALVNMDAAQLWGMLALSDGDAPDEQTPNDPAQGGGR
ncbi:DEAD/DEAH box helicase [Brachybacterium sp. MASK1Z-5]|uniref:DEAD/DEAH box helicase n=1 Tax=Brachybacterium halotolerans TaxID=2795215 RepID=A0ABS1BCR4_9MICO|nr:DEAD/DEAH box helicase [Brachybacterium halotolerans]MBK0332443.1 DEAD/DEAH box helicase [Brachybacterium halotolerans]